MNGLRLRADATPPPLELPPPPLTEESARIRVQELLVQIVGQIQVNTSGGLSFPYGSTRVFVNVATFDGDPVVTVHAVTNVNVPRSPALFEHIAMKADSWVFGHLGLETTPNGMNVLFRRTIPASPLDLADVRHAVGAVAYAADRIDEEIASQFGGRRYRDVEAEALASDLGRPAETPTTNEGLAETEQHGYL